MFSNKNSHNSTQLPNVIKRLCLQSIVLVERKLHIVRLRRYLALYIAIDILSSPMYSLFYSCVKPYLPFFLFQRLSILCRPANDAALQKESEKLKEEEGMVELRASAVTSELQSSIN